MESKQAIRDEMIKEHSGIVKDERYMTVENKMFEDAYFSVSQQRNIDAVQIEDTERIVELGMSAVDILNDSELTPNSKKASLDALKKGVGVGDIPALHHDLDDLAGTWVPDEATEQALDKMRQVDQSMW